MSHSNNHQDPLEFAVSAKGSNGQKDTNAILKVFDGHGKLLVTEEGSISTQLPGGLYTVRIERLGEMREEVIIHRDKTNRDIALPLRNSAMPMGDTKHTNKFLEDAAIKYSRISTFEQPDIDKSWPRLMIMIRASGNDQNSIAPMSIDLALFDDKGKRITRFGPSETRPPQGGSFTVFSAQLEPGNYMLVRYGVARVQMLPVILYDRWDNFVFVPYQKGSKLSASSVKIVRHDEGYDPNDELSAQIDAALLGLGSRLDLLSKADRNAAIYGKFAHPLIGLIGAYSHFLGDSRKEKLERQVLRNLWKLLPGSPDVIALLLMSLERDEGQLPYSREDLDRAAIKAFGENIGHRLPLTFPPILNTALQVIMRATQDMPFLVGQESWLEVAGNSSFGSGVWATWDQLLDDDLVEKDMKLDFVSAPLPSTQKVYPAVKRVLAQRSMWSPREISAKTDLAKFMEPSQKNVGSMLKSIEKLLQDVDAEIPNYRLDVTSHALEETKTVKDLVARYRDRVLPITAESRSLASVEFKPRSEVPEWLVEAVQDQVDSNQFNAGEMAKKYAVSKHSIELAAKLKK